MLILELDHLLQERLEAVARKTGRSIQDVALEAVVERIEDLEDAFVALDRLANDDGVRIPIEEVMRELEAREARERTQKPAAE